MVKTERYVPSVFIASLAIYLFFMPLDFMPVIPGISLSKVLILIPLVGSIFSLESFGRFKKISLVILLYPLAIFISMFSSISFNDSLERMISVCLNIFVIIYISSRRYNKSEIDYLLNAVALSGWLLLALCVLFSQISADGRLTVMINGISQDQNYLCGFFLLPSCYYLWNFLESKKIFGLISIICFSMFILLTGSRGGVLSLVVSFLALLFKTGLSSQKKIIKIVIFLLFAILFILIIWEFLPEEIIIRFSSDFNEKDKGAHRLEVWESLLTYFGKSSFLRQLFGNGAATVMKYSFEGRVAHNVFIESMVEMGVLGLLFILVMYGYYGILSWKNKKCYLFSSFVGYMVMCLTLSLYNYKAIWNVILLICISINVSKTEDYQKMVIQSKV